MGLSLIERYVFRKALIAMLTASGALIAVIWVARAVSQVDVILSKGQGILTYLSMTSLGVPALAAAVAPLALLLALLQTINQLNNDSELVVMHASGASRLSLLKPFVLLSLLVTITVYVLALHTGPKSMAKLREYIVDMRADLVSVIVREGAFQDVGSGLTFHVAARAPGGVLKGVFMLDGRNPKETLTYLAREGDIARIGNNSFLILREGEIQRLNNETNALSVIKYESYAFNLSSLTQNHYTGISTQMEIPTWDLLYPDPEVVYYKYYPERVRAEFHTRFTSGLHPLVVGLIVLAFVGNPASHRQGQRVAAASAAGLIILLRTISIVAEGSMRDVPALAILVWGLPFLAMAGASIYLVTGASPVSRRAQTAVEDWLGRWADRFWALVSRVMALRGNRNLDGAIPDAAQ